MPSTSGEKGIAGDRCESRRAAVEKAGLCLVLPLPVLKFIPDLYRSRASLIGHPWKGLRFDTFLPCHKRSW